MTVEADVRAAIKTKMLTVANIGTVNDYERYSDQMSKLTLQYVASISGHDQLLGWHIRRVSKREIFVDTGRWSIHNRWRIRGFMALDDAAATEKTFDALLVALDTAFRADDSLGSVVLSCIDPESGEAGLQLVDSKPVLFAGVLCHSAEIGLHTQHLL
jgi:hypothetical protein